MHVFVTGASGFIGRATVADLLAHGHTVLGLARSDASASTLSALGPKVQVLRGDLENAEVLKQGASSTDGTIHLGFIHDFNNFAHGLAVDAAAVEAIGSALEGTGKPFVVVSGTLSLAKDGSLNDEDSPHDNAHPLSARNKASDLLFALSSEKNIRGSVVRFSPTVHGAEDSHGFVPSYAAAAKRNGFVTIIGEGSVRWPAVHQKDAAALTRLALEKGTPGAVYHAIAEPGVPVKETMEAIGKRLGLPVEKKSPEEAMQLLGFFGGLLMADNPTTSEKTQRALGWKPEQVGLIEDIEKNYVFA